ncbi:hypothetical protein [Acidiphilium sp.]|uniref:hypothetical protein n=1 Tax=Acidiphilium sp. TaxID=527 RepID=UPI003D0299C9
MTLPDAQNRLAGTVSPCQVFRQMPDNVRPYEKDPGRGDDRLWAVIATIGRVVRIADIHASHTRAQADQIWREQQVRAYLGFLQRCELPVPRYTIRSMSRAQLPRGWRPLPALGFLNGRMF